MKTRALSQDNSQSNVQQLPSDTQSLFQDQRPESAALQRFQSFAAESPRNTQLKSIQHKMAASLRVQQLKTLQSRQQGVAPVQRLKWSEVYTGAPKEVVSISDKQMPESVEAVEGENATVDRNVWAGQTKKGRSGFLWHKESTLEVQYDIKSMQQYRIIDAEAVFYTAVRTSAVEAIKKFGINPNYGNAEKPDGSTQYNVRGFNYFGKDRKIPELYGSNYLAPEPWTMMSFKLPEGTLIERDPEIPNGLRTTYHVKPSDLVG